MGWASVLTSTAGAGWCMPLPDSSRPGAGPGHATAHVDGFLRFAARWRGWAGRTGGMAAYWRTGRTPPRVPSPCVCRRAGMCRGRTALGNTGRAYRSGGDKSGRAHGGAHRRLGGAGVVHTDESVSRPGRAA